MIGPGDIRFNYDLGGGGLMDMGCELLFFTSPSQHSSEPTQATPSTAFAISRLPTQRQW
jgi:hypothetical protein